MDRLRFLLDTNILSEPTKRSPEPKVLARLRKHQSESATAATVIHEMRHGLGRLPSGRRRMALTDYLERLLRQPIAVLAYDRDAAIWHADQRVALDGQGGPTPYADGQIAAIAATNGLTRVTRNVSDFGHFGGLAIENWFD
ncbi:type II toxin-antitoxin system VapC family toxin [uncultured Thiodictyon sp.]|uniref:type II toxin-antitoxin system VapC family toxin n=1 Tax=uncultured Thiodictyon sp. TaxID=1846217 RepID=UPI0025EEBCBF|nr:type II toxin-antitoxin system VapC family toxin [uncultured Thiodictyon sp.]